MQREHRAIRPAEIRATPDSRMFEAVVLNYGVIDDYRTIFDAGVFKASLEARMPRITWAHDWAEPLGRYIDYKDTADSLTLIGEFDDFDAVPRARQAHAQLVSGTIDQFSVGFHREDGGTYEDGEGVTHFRSAGLDEASLVLVGAVPGTKLLSVRTADGGRREMDRDVLVGLAEDVLAGKLTKEAMALVIQGATGTLLDTPAPVDTGQVVSDGTFEQADEVAAALGFH